METIILQTCARVGSYAATWEVSRDSDVLNHCSCRSKCLTLPKVRVPSGGTRGTTPLSVPGAFAGALGGIYMQRRRGPGDWLRLGDKAKVIWLDVADYRFSCVCLMCRAKAQVDQSHPALSHHPYGRISFQVSCEGILSCCAEPRTLKLYSLSHLFPKVSPLLFLYIHSTTDCWHFTA